MTREEADFIGGMNMCDEISNEAYKKIMCHCEEQEPCADAISRQAVDTLVDELARAISDERCCISRGRNTATIMQDILNLPSVTPQPKTGHWIEHEHNGILHIECSECLSWFLRAHLLRNSYCPNCGAKMKAESEDEE